MKTRIQATCQTRSRLLAIRWFPDFREYSVGPQGGRMDDAQVYHTPDPDDAVNTLLAMAMNEYGLPDGMTCADAFTRRHNCMREIDRACTRHPFLREKYREYNLADILGL